MPHVWKRIKINVPAGFAHLLCIIIYKQELRVLVEFTNVRQIPKEGSRRWFKDQDSDLIIWYDDNEISGFQLCYNKIKQEKALTWFKKGGYSHNKIDDGEGEYSNSGKMTPILVQDGSFDKDAVAEYFKENASKLEYELVDFVYNKLQEYS